MKRESVVRGLFAKFDVMNVRWAEQEGALFDRLRRMPLSLDPAKRVETLRNGVAEAGLLARNQRSAISVMASTAIEHRGAWKLALTEIRQSLGLHQAHIGEAERMDKRHHQARLALLRRWATDVAWPTPSTVVPAVVPSNLVPPALAPSGDASSAPPVTEPPKWSAQDLPVAIRTLIDEWTVRDSTGSKTTDADLINRIENRLHLTEEHSSNLTAVLSEWQSVVTDQRNEMTNRAVQAHREFHDMVVNQGEQTTAAAVAVSRSDAYRGNVAIGLALASAALSVFGLTVAARNRWSDFNALLTGSIVNAVALMVIVGGMGIVVLQSAAMPVSAEQSNTVKNKLRLGAFMSIFVVTALSYLATAVYILGDAGDRTFALIAAPILIGAAVLATAFVLIFRRPQTLDEAADDGADESLAGEELTNEIRSGRYATVLQALRALTARRRMLFARQAKYWSRVTLWLGVPATLLTALGAATGFTDLTKAGAAKYIVATVALIGSALAGVSTSLNAGGRAESAQSRSGSLESLSREIQVARTLDLSTWTDEQRRVGVEDFLQRINVLGDVKDQTSLYLRQHPPAPS